MTDEKKKDIKASAQKIWLAGVGALAMAEEEGSKLFQTLVEKGEGAEWLSSEGRVRKTVSGVGDRAGSAFKQVETVIDDQVSGALGRLGVPSRDEIAELTRKVETLTERLEQVRRKPEDTTEETSETA